jgi:uncharacterized membrane protein YphA (DoxX/SURF4 family)
MPDRRLVRAFLALYATIGVVVLIQSIQTVLAARRGALPQQDRLHATVLGSLEAGAALLFLLPRTMRLGAVGLLAVFAIAFALHASRGDVSSTLLVYAAAVFFVRTHGIVGRPAVDGAAARAAG